LEQVFSFNELLQVESSKLATMSFEIVTGGKDENQPTSFVQLRKKIYKKGEEERILVQFIDISNEIMYEQVHAENEFLAITNATVSHELRNPLQSICSQNLKIKLCLKELLNILKSK
jgi:signal transduction histidine kinase